MSIHKKINFNWLVLLVGFALSAQEQKMALQSRNEINSDLINGNFVDENKTLLIEENQTQQLTFVVLFQNQNEKYISNLGFYRKSSQITVGYKENEGLINSGIARFVKIEFAGKKLKGFKDFNSRTIV